MIISCEDGDYEILHGEDHCFESNKEIHVISSTTDFIRILDFGQDPKIWDFPKEVIDYIIKLNKLSAFI